MRTISILDASFVPRFVMFWVGGYVSVAVVGIAQYAAELSWKTRIDNDFLSYHIVHVDKEMMPK